MVAGAATPDIILACHKIKAIVTDQGGLGSHATIVSRELGIPCVVGTRDATSVIKTGDILTVDGDRGMVVVHGQR